MHLKTLALLLLSTLSCFAQFKYNNYTAHTTSTNGYLSANAASTNVNLTMSVAQGNYAQVQIAYSLCSTNTNAVPSSATNLVTTYWDVSMDGSRFTNTFTIDLRSITNGEVWTITNFAVTYPWLRYKYLSNANPAHLTNLTVKVGQKTGL